MLRGWRKSPIQDRAPSSREARALLDLAPGETPTPARPQQKRREEKRVCSPGRKKRKAQQGSHSRSGTVRLCLPGGSLLVGLELSATLLLPPGSQPGSAAWACAGRTHMPVPEPPVPTRRSAFRPSFPGHLICFQMLSTFSHYQPLFSREFCQLCGLGLASEGGSPEAGTHS